MTPYAIFMDVDGTLLAEDQIISPITKSTIARLQTAGHRFFIASGRPLFAAQEIAESAGEGLDVIASNGSVFSVGGQVQAVHLSAAALTALYHVHRQYDLATFVFSQDNVSILDEFPAHMTEEEHARIALRDPSTYPRIKSLAELQAQRNTITNALIIEETRPEILVAAREMLAEVADIDLSSSFKFNIEITAHGVNKASAITQICTALGIPISHTMAFGDGDNDLEMLQTVAHGVAMGNANDAVKAVTPHLTRPVEENGVAVFLNDFFPA